MHWFCANCESSTLISIKTDKEIAQRCSSLMAAMDETWTGSSSSCNRCTLLACKASRQGVLLTSLTEGVTTVYRSLYACLKASFQCNATRNESNATRCLRILKRKLTACVACVAWNFITQVRCVWCVALRWKPAFNRSQLMSCIENYNSRPTVNRT